MRPALLAAALVLAAGSAVAASPPPPPPWIEPPALVPEGTGFCGVFLAGPGRATCTYYSVTPFGELRLHENGLDATITVRCTAGSGEQRTSGATTVAHAGKCLVALDATGSGFADGWFRSVATP